MYYIAAHFYGKKKRIHYYIYNLLGSVCSVIYNVFISPVFKKGTTNFLVYTSQK
jgi:hypothetical protein